MYSIGQFAKKTGLTIRALRYYDEKNLLKPALISEGGQRFYDDSNLITVQKIVTFKYLDFTVEEIRQLLEEDLPILASFQQQKVLLEQKRQQLDRIIASLDTAISIHEKTDVQDPTIFLLVLHTLLTEEQQKEFLRQYLPQSLIDELYSLFDSNLVELNRKYIELSYAIKEAYANNVEGAELKTLLERFFNIFPEDMRLKIETAFADVALEGIEIDNWLFPSPFTPEEEQWIMAQIEQLQVLGGTMDETATD